MPATSTAHEVRQAIQELASDSASYSKSGKDLLDLRFIRTAKKNWGRFAMADTSGRELTYGRTLIASLLVSRWVRSHCAGEEMIGVLLPSSVGGVLANTGVMTASKVFLAKAKIEAMDGAVYMEDILGQVSGFEKLRALLSARLLPARWLTARRKRTTDSLATVIFSSGSSGLP